MVKKWVVEDGDGNFVDSFDTLEEAEACDRRQVLQLGQRWEGKIIEQHL